MDQEIVNSILFKLNQLVDKVVNLEYKVDLLATHLKHKDKQQQTTKSMDFCNLIEIIYNNCCIFWILFF